MVIDPALRNSIPTPGGSRVPDITRDESNQRSGSESIPFHDLQNPSDALDILAQIASDDGRINQQIPWNMGSEGGTGRLSSISDSHWLNGAFDYELVRSGQLTPSRIVELVERYKRLYHPYFALVPPSTFEPQNLPRVARCEPHLLTAILVIAAKDVSDLSLIHI